jgi:integrase
VGGKQPTIGRSATGATGDKKRGLSFPVGVTLRKLAQGDRLQIAFTIHGVECRELLEPQPITQTAVNKAGGLRAEITRRISIETFVYSDYFPKSRRAAQFDRGGRQILMDKLLTAQLETYELQVKNGTLSPSTYEGYRKALTGERMKFWRPLSLAEASAPSCLREWVTGLGLTAKAARNLLTPLRSVFEDALNGELIESNPFDRVALSKLLRQTTKPSEYEVDPFDASERSTVLKHARSDEAPLVRFWFNSGLRPGELIALRWSKVDWAASTARIDTNWVVRTEKAPKTAAGIRDLDLNGEAIAALLEQKAFSFEAGDHVFLNPRSGAAWESDAQIRKTLWEPLLRRAAVRYRAPYQARHTYASAMLTAGQNPWYVAQQLGHVDVEMVFRIYGKFIAADYQRPRLEGKGSPTGE